MSTTGKAANPAIVVDGATLRSPGGGAGVSVVVAEASDHGGMTTPDRLAAPGLANLATPAALVKSVPYTDAASVQAAKEDGSQFGRYTLGACLGVGGMGAVYLAWDPSLQRQVALKVVRDAVASDPHAGLRLLREARAAASIRHPNVVSIYEVGEHDGTPFIAMEFVEGTSLRSLIRESALSQAEATNILLDIASALDAAHRNGVVHRDIKPENVMRSSVDGTVKVLDFGIAKINSSTSQLEELTATGAVVGTPRYMSPEQLRGEALDGRADQFAWAVMAVELLTGCSPWPETTAAELMAAILTSEPSLEARSTLSKDTRKALRKALSKRVSDRYFTVSDAARDVALGQRKRRRAIPPPPPLSVKVVRNGTVIAAATTLMDAIGVASVRVAKRPTRNDVAAAVTRESSEFPTSLDSEPVDRDVDLALQLWADGARLAARESFEKLYQKDPSRWRARLLWVAASEWIDTAEREQLRASFPMRGRLEAADNALLEALQPLVVEPPDVGSTTARLRHAIAQFPSNKGLRLALAQHYLRTRDGASALELASTWNAKDGYEGTAKVWLSARANLQLGRTKQARENLSECVLHAPIATDCLEKLARLDLNEGRCHDGEVDARKIISASPDSPAGYVLLASAVMGQTHSAEATRAILRERWKRTPDAIRQEVETSNEFVLHVQNGDFDEADLDLQAWQNAANRSSDAFRRGYPLVMRVAFELERGRPERAKAAARELSLGQRAWVSSNFFDVTIESDRVLYQTDLLTRPAFIAARDQAYADQERRGGYYSSQNIRWYDCFVQTARTAEDANDAIRIAPAHEPYIDPTDTSVSVETALGNMFLLAGATDHSIEHLQVATTSCSFGDPIDSMHAQLLLGDALAMKGDAKQACASYEKIIRVWGRQESSVTAKSARTKYRTCRNIK